MTNIGIAPHQPATSVGALRQLVGATAFVPLSPDVAGFGDYEWYSDADLQGALIVAQGNLRRAAGDLLMQLSTQFAAMAVVTQSDDQRTDLTKRAADVRANAQVQYDQADNLEDRAAANDAFVGLSHSLDSLDDDSMTEFPRQTPRYDSPFESLGLREDPTNPGYWVQ